jgi:hypothetical protein
MPLDPRFSGRVNRPRARNFLAAWFLRLHRANGAA